MTLTIELDGARVKVSQRVKYLTYLLTYVLKYLSQRSFRSKLFSADIDTHTADRLLYPAH